MHDPKSSFGVVYGPKDRKIDTMEIKEKIRFANKHHFKEGPYDNIYFRKAQATIKELGPQVPNMRQILGQQKNIQFDKDRSGQTYSTLMPEIQEKQRLSNLTQTEHKDKNSVNFKVAYHDKNDPINHSFFQENEKRYASLDNSPSKYGVKENLNIYKMGKATMSGVIHDDQKKWLKNPTDDYKNLNKAMSQYRTMKKDLMNLQKFSIESRILGHRGTQFKIPINTYLDHYTSVKSSQPEGPGSNNLKHLGSNVFDSNQKMNMNNTGPVYPQHQTPAPKYKNLAKLLSKNNSTSCLQNPKNSALFALNSLPPGKDNF